MIKLVDKREITLNISTPSSPILAGYILLIFEEKNETKSSSSFSNTGRDPDTTVRSHHIHDCILDWSPP